MGGVLANVMEQKEDEELLAHIGMTHHQVDLVIHSWATIKKFGAEEAGVLLFLRFFEVAPDTLVMFKDFRDLPNWTESKEFRHHCKIWMNILGSAVGLLKDPDSVDSTLEYLGTKHQGFAITDKHFELLGIELMETFREILGHEMTSDVEQAWLALYKFMTKMIVSNMSRTTEMRYDACHENENK